MFPTSVGQQFQQHQSVGLNSSLSLVMQPPLSVIYAPLHPLPAFPHQVSRHLSPTSYQLPFVHSYPNTVDTFSSPVRASFVDPVHSPYRFSFPFYSNSQHPSAFRPIAPSLTSPASLDCSSIPQKLVVNEATSFELQPPRSSSTASCQSRKPIETVSDSLVQTLKTILLPQQSLPPSDSSSATSEVNDQLLNSTTTTDDDRVRGVTAFDGTTVLCQVCGDRASGFHYGTYSCEGCKGFFRRSIQQKIQYRPCTKNQQCSILRINRNRCQYCRLKKCIAVGMSRDAVRFGRVPKREKAKILEEMHRASVRSHLDSLTTELEDETRLVAAIVAAHVRTCQRNQLIPSSNLTSCPSACPLGPSDDLSERYLPAMKGVVEFAKAVPGFHFLSQEDRVTLLKAGMFEVLLLRLTVLFDSDSGSLFLPDGSIYRRHDDDGQCPSNNNNNNNCRCSPNRGHFLVDSLFDFVERFNGLGILDADIALFCALVLFSSDRPGLYNRQLVEKLNQRLRSVLQKVIQLHHPNRPKLFDQVIMKTADLRTLSTLHQEKLLTFKTRSNTASSPCNERQISREEDTSQWSMACKASEGTPSSSPTPPSTSNGRPEPFRATNRLRQMHVSSSDEKPIVYPIREASSFDSGKGTLSNKASSGSDTDSSDDGRTVPHSTMPALKHMPALKRALQTPSKVSIRDRHRAVASLLERPSELSRTATDSVLWKTLLRVHPISNNNSSIPTALHVPTIVQQYSSPQTAHSRTSPKRDYPFDDDVQPLNLSKKRSPSLIL